MRFNNSWKRDRETPYRMGPMTYEQLVELAGNYNKDSRILKDAPKEIAILDLLDQTASVLLTAHWGIGLHAPGQVQRPVEDYQRSLAVPSAEVASDTQVTETR